MKKPVKRPEGVLKSKGTPHPELISMGWHLTLARDGFNAARLQIEEDAQKSFEEHQSFSAEQVSNWICRIVSL